MNCEEADGLLLDYVEETLDASQRATLEGHLAKCSRCRTALRDTRHLLGALSEAREQEGRLPNSAPRDAAPSRDAPTPTTWKPGSRLGDFEIVGEIGRGGMGVVYRARQLSLNRIVALKVLPALAGADDKAVSRFVREAQAAARLHHTNIVPVYAQGQHDGHFYYAMELIDGESLDRVIRRRRAGAEARDRSSKVGHAHPTQSPAAHAPPLDDFHTASAALLVSLDGSRFRDVAMLICGAAEGLEHAHNAGVLHRDIKPQNLLLGSDGQLHITDFGLARLLDEPGMTLTGEMIGTPAYMSPEQVGFARRTVDHRTDVFSLGVTLYELLTLERPFDGVTREQLVARICTREPKPPRKINPSIPTDLETICLRALEKDASRRYTSAGALAADLRRFVENRPIHARRVGLLEKGWKFIRRHPALTTICVLVALLIGGGLLWRSQSQHARRERSSELIARAFSLLAHDDYRKPAEAKQLLAQAQALWPAADDAVGAIELITTGLSDLRADPQNAVRILTQSVATAKSPDERRTARYLLAWAERLRTGRLDGEALRWLAEADAIPGERSAEEHFFRGQALVRHRPDEAIGEFRLAREKRNNYAQAMLHLARALNTKMYHQRRHDTFDEQERVLLNACELQSTHAYPCYLLSITYRLSAEIYERARTDSKRRDEHFDWALHWAREAQRREPTSPRGYACEAEYWEAVGDLNRAIDARNRGEPHCRSPDDLAELHEYRWRLYYWLGRHDEALADLRALQEFTAPGAGGQGDARRIWFAGLFPALVHLDKGQPEAAERMVRAVADAEPRSARASYSAAAILQLVGRLDEAEQLIARIPADAEPLAVMEESAPPDWERKIRDVCSGRQTLSALRAAADDSMRRNKLLWSAAYFFDGLRKLVDGKQGTAAMLLDACEQTFDYADYCYAARVVLGRLQRDSTWPQNALNRDP
ncbi:Serine/threonine-protein kinase PrkC [Phycisphaerae bacterium RAS2]|nr:Serine/threonine-protein kinase PrkC [Phycisphaerae bacterium RAS2]